MLKLKVYNSKKFLQDIKFTVSEVRSSNKKKFPESRKHTHGNPNEI